AFLPAGMEAPIDSAFVGPSLLDYAAFPTLIGARARRLAGDLWLWAGRRHRGSALAPAAATAWVREYRRRCVLSRGDERQRREPWDLRPPVSHHPAYGRRREPGRQGDGGQRRIHGRRKERRKNKPQRDSGRPHRSTRKYRHIRS